MARVIRDCRTANLPVVLHVKRQNSAHAHVYDSAKQDRTCYSDRRNRLDSVAPRVKVSRSKDETKTNVLLLESISKHI